MSVFLDLQGMSCGFGDLAHEARFAKQDHEGKRSERLLPKRIALKFTPF